MGIAHFGAQHICWLLIWTAVCVSLCLLYRRAGDTGKRRMALAVGALLGALELTRELALALTGLYSLDYLPLHMCGLAIFITIWHAVRGGDTAAEILYSVGMPGAAFALVFPDWLFYPVLNLLSLISFCVHILLVSYPVMLIAGKRFRPSPARLPRCLLFLAASAIPMYLFDKLTDTNYMFLNWPSKGSPLEWFYNLWGNPGYLAGYVPLLAAVWIALYLPWALADKFKKRRQVPDDSPPVT